MSEQAGFIDPRLVALADEADAAAGPDGMIVFKWTCAGCGERSAFNEPSTVYIMALHQEKSDGTICGYSTNLNTQFEVADVGYMLILANVPASKTGKLLDEAMRRRDAIRDRIRRDQAHKN